jgi:di/tricarboxylate transporter
VTLSDGAAPRRRATEVAIAASCDFLTPIGSQTSTMVYGPGRYRFGDYARLGAPPPAFAVSLIVLVAQ